MGSQGSDLACSELEQKSALCWDLGPETQRPRRLSLFPGDSWPSPAAASWAESGGMLTMAKVGLPEDHHTAPGPSLVQHGQSQPRSPIKRDITLHSGAFLLQNLAWDWLPSGFCYYLEFSSSENTLLMLSLNPSLSSLLCVPEHWVNSFSPLLGSRKTAPQVMNMEAVPYTEPLSVFMSHNWSHKQVLRDKREMYYFLSLLAITSYRHFTHNYSEQMHFSE